MINRLKKSIYKPFFLISMWMFFLASPFVDSLNLFLLQRNFTASFGLNLIFGVFRRVYIPTFSIIVIMFFVLWYRNILKPNLMNRGHHIALLLIGTISVIYDVVIQLLLNLEQVKYANYLYSRFGLRLATLSLVSIVNLIFIAIIIAFYILLFNRTVVIKKPKLKYNLNLSIYITFVGIIVSIALSMYPYLNILKLFREVGQGYEERLGPSFAYIQALVVSTPSNSVIIHPPQSQNWPLVGNQPMIRYFLFPRMLVSGVLVSNQSEALKFDGAFFVKIPADGNVPEWPTIDIVKNTIIFDQVNKINFKSLRLVKVYDRKEIFNIIFK